MAGWCERSQRSCAHTDVIITWGQGGVKGKGLHLPNVQ